MTNEKLTELLKIAYRCGRDNSEGRSDKNFNDLLQTEAISQALRIHDVVGRSEQLCDPLSHNADIMMKGLCSECMSNKEI